MNMRYQIRYDGSDNDLEWVMWYTGWSKETTVAALKQWSANNSLHPK